MRSLLILTGAVASLAAMGCSSPLDERPDAEATSSTATAIVVVERSLGPGETTRGDAVIARFVRVRQGTVDDQALRVAGAAWELPAPGTCSSTQEVPPTLQPRTVDLLDVGTLTVEPTANSARSFAAPKSTILQPRTMPDPTGVVSGVFYSVRSAEVFTPAARLQLSTNGGPDLAEGFRVDVAAPHDVADVHVTSTSSGLDISWETEPTTDGRDVVYIDVLGPSSHLVARCTTSDAGQFTVPASSIGALGPSDLDTSGQISVHRLHRESFRTKGIEPGEVRFDVARVIGFKR